MFLNKGPFSSFGRWNKTDCKKENLLLLGRDLSHHAKPSTEPRFAVWGNVTANTLLFFYSRKKKKGLFRKREQEIFLFSFFAIRLGQVILTYMIHTKLLNHQESISSMLIVYKLCH